MTTIYITPRGRAMLGEQFKLHKALFPEAAYIPTRVTLPEHVRRTNKQFNITPPCPHIIEAAMKHGGGNTPSGAPVGVRV